MNYEDEQFKAAYNLYMKLTNDALKSGLSIHMIAAVMTTIGLSLYRSSLSEEDYNDMIEAMLELKDQVTIFEENKETMH